MKIGEFEQMNHLINTDQAQLCLPIIDSLQQQVSDTITSFAYNPNNKYYFEYLVIYSGLLIDTGERTNITGYIYNGIYILNQVNKLRPSCTCKYYISNGLSIIIAKLSINSRFLEEYELTKWYKNLCHSLNKSSIDLSLPDYHINKAAFYRHTCRRPVDALYELGVAININNNHPVALRERAFCIEELAFLIHSEQRNGFYNDALIDLLNARKHEIDLARKQSIDIGLKKRYKGNISDHVPPKCESQDIDSLPKEEREFVLYCINHQLFLNLFTPDHRCHSVYYDSLVIETFYTLTKDSDKATKIIHYFNVIKSEYVSSRRLLYTYHSQEDKIDDKNLRLIDSNRNYVYGTKTNNIILSIRTSFSILDKIAFAVNEYFKIQFDQDRITFRNLSLFIGNNSNDKLVNFLMSNHDISPYFYGLIDVATDLSSDREKYMKKARNIYEHRFSAITVDMSTPEDTIPCYSQSEILDIGLTMLKKAKSVLFQFALLIGHEEQRHKPNPSQSITIDMHNIK